MLCTRLNSSSSSFFSFLLLSFLLLLPLAESALEEVPSGGGVHFVAASQGRHHQERSTGSHVTDRGCLQLHLWLLQDARVLPTCSGGLLAPWSVVRHSSHLRRRVVVSFRQSSCDGPRRGGGPTARVYEKATQERSRLSADVWWWWWSVRTCVLMRCVWPYPITNAPNYVGRVPVDTTSPKSLPLISASTARDAWPPAEPALTCRCEAHNCPSGHTDHDAKVHGPAYEEESTARSAMSTSKTSHRSLTHELVSAVKPSFSAKYGDNIEVISQRPLEEREILPKSFID